MDSGTDSGFCSASFAPDQKQDMISSEAFQNSDSKSPIHSIQNDKVNDLSNHKMHHRNPSFSQSSSSSMNANSNIQALDQFSVSFNIQSFVEIMANYFRPVSSVTLSNSNVNNAPLVKSFIRFTEVGLLACKINISNILIF